MSELLTIIIAKGMENMYNNVSVYSVPDLINYSSKKDNSITATRTIQ